MKFQLLIKIKMNINKDILAFKLSDVVFSKMATLNDFFGIFIIYAHDEFPAQSSQ